jgi:integrase/recombinase XerD
MPGRPSPVGCHTWRATGVTIYLANGGRFEQAPQMAGHESPRTTKVYDRTRGEISVGEVERSHSPGSFLPRMC